VAVVLFACPPTPEKQTASQTRQRADYGFSSSPAFGTHFRISQTTRRVTTQSIEQATGESRSTIKARLKQLTIDRLLIRYGKGRSTWYGLN
jgi:predicted HTH transcriptional regulator